MLEKWCSKDFVIIKKRKIVSPKIDFDDVKRYFEYKLYLLRKCLRIVVGFLKMLIDLTLKVTPSRRLKYIILKKIQRVYSQENLDSQT